jgi:hypothetical protein
MGKTTQFRSLFWIGEGNVSLNTTEDGSRNQGNQTTALERISEAIQAVEACEGELTPDGYKELRARLGHLMDALFKVGGSLSKTT